jgi:hypothetical protein
MSVDARNSIYLWVSVLTLFGILWASFKVDLLRGLPTEWLWPLFAAVGVANLASFSWGLWRRRVRNHGGPSNS